jgi:hypothetical protein
MVKTQKVEGLINAIKAYDAKMTNPRWKQTSNKLGV